MASEICATLDQASSNLSCSINNGNLDMDVNFGDSTLGFTGTLDMHLCPASATDPIKIGVDADVTVFGTSYDIPLPTGSENLIAQYSNKGFTFSPDVISFPTALFSIMEAGPRLNITPTLTSTGVKVELSADFCMGFDFSLMASISDTLNELDGQEKCSADLASELAEITSVFDVNAFSLGLLLAGVAGVTVDSLEAELNALKTDLDGGLVIGSWEFDISELCTTEQAGFYTAQVNALETVSEGSASTITAGVSAAAIALGASVFF